ncbi:hypothetical protein VTO73DRAFT_8223 [Trametes versicolor]
MSKSRMAAARRKIASSYLEFKSAVLGVNSVTFQPKGDDENEDRIVVEPWEIYGQRWLFLAVFDGHIGNTTADYAARALTPAIRATLQEFIRSIGGRLDRSNIATHAPQVTTLLKNEIEMLDKRLGDAVREVCPRPEELTQEQARRLIEEHHDILRRAFSGTTVAFTLIEVDQRFMWAAGVGDSSVGLSYIDRDGRRRGKRLCTMHTFKDRQEYFYATMAHPSSEQPLFDHEDRMLGWMSVARAIGDFSLKLPAPYLANLFRYLPDFEEAPFDKYIPKIKTPPYIYCWPSVRFTDLEPYWGRQSKVFLFTDGVDNLVDGCMVFKPRQHSGADPIDVVSALLADHIEPRIPATLGHPVVPRWCGRDSNRAADVLGNLLGGMDVERLEMVTDLELLNGDASKWPFHIDDTSIIVWHSP